MVYPQAVQSIWYPPDARGMAPFYMQDYMTPSMPMVVSHPYGGMSDVGISAHGIGASPDMYMRMSMPPHIPMPPMPIHPTIQSLSMHNAPTDLKNIISLGQLSALHLPPPPPPPEPKESKRI